MSEITGRTSTMLAERKPQIQKAGGCVGIFFQLFDWNRRFTKKKFFPKKLLPPVRTKVSKKFNAEEKLPVSKHLLIADENSGCGISSKLKKNGVLGPKKHEMQAPGLVARLMGLEAMLVPDVENSNSNEDLPKDDCTDFGDGARNGLTKEGLSLSPEKGNVRPQKIQKTGMLDRRPITRFGAEALQIKNGLSRSRKHHSHPHPKLTSPVKSPKGGRSSSRLIDIAARILEPGIQATNRARHSLTYSNFTMNQDQSWKDGLSSEVRNDDLKTQVLNTHAACHSCGNILDHMDVRYNEQSSMDVDMPPSDFRHVFLHGLDDDCPRSAVYLEHENDVVLLKTRYRPDSVPPQTRDNRSPVKKETIRNEMHDLQSLEQKPVSKMFTSQKNASPSVALKHRAQKHGKMLVGDRVPPKSRATSTQGRRVSPPVNSVNETKDFIAINRNMSRNRQRLPSKPDGDVEVERRFYTGRNDPLATQRSPVRKRRTPNAVRSVDNSSAASSSEKQRSNKINTVIASETRIRSAPTDQTRLRSKPASQRGSKNTDIVSFAFNSPVRSTTAKTVDEMDARDPTSSVTSKSLHHSVNKPNQKSLRMNGDALGAILEQKLKELSHQVETEAATGFTPSARTTASILQELISALTAEKPVSCEEESTETDTKDSECNSEVADNVSQAKLRSKRSSNGLTREIDHFSPGCVLDASFSNDSGVSSSIDDNSVQPVSSTHTDLLDSASSTNKCGHGVMMVTSLINHTSAILQDVNCVHSRLSSTKLNDVQEIVLNAELLFGNVCQSSSRFLDFLLGPFLDELESLVIAAWKNSIILGIEVRKEESPLRRFLLDCLVECLDIKYTRYSDSGFKAWSKLPKSIDAEILIKSFDEEVRKWISFAGKSSDNIIEREMSTSLGKWTDFEIEAFETGAQISQDLVQVLVDEIVTDLYSSKLSFF